jgi:hypothetical protein
MNKRVLAITGIAGLGFVWYFAYASKQKSKVLVPNDAFKNKQGYSNMMRAETRYTSADFVKGTDAQINSYSFPDVSIYDSWGLGENGGHALAISGSPGDRYGGLVVADTRAAKYATSWKLNAVQGSHL